MIISPGKQIPEHCGKHKGLIRYHLGLRVPEPKTACGISIGDEIAHWEKGKSLIFDDTFPHADLNNSNGYRVMLFLDIAKSDCTGSNEIVKDSRSRLRKNLIGARS